LLRKDNSIFVDSLLNVKIDAVSVKDQKESLAYTKEVIEKEAGIENVVVYPISSRDALEGKEEGDQDKTIKNKDIANTNQTILITPFSCLRSDS